MRNKLGNNFFEQSPEKLAQALLGKVLVHQLKNGDIISGKIVETEAYLGPEDKAAHSYKKRTARTEAMYMKPGTIYIFSIYGMYHCMNISSFGDGAAVLLRAVEPIAGMEQMKVLRCQKQNIQRDFLQHQLCNGPSKICLSFGIGKEFNTVDITSSDSVWIEESWDHPQMIVTSTRIGLSKKAEEWITAPLRYYVLDSKSVSVIDRKIEDQIRSKAIGTIK